MMARSSRGQLLVVVLWVMGMTSIAAGSVIMQATHGLQLGQIPSLIARQRAAAESAPRYASALLRADSARDAGAGTAVDHVGEAWATGLDPDGGQLLVAVPLGSASFSIGTREGSRFHPGMIDEERKLHLNAANPDTLRRLIELVDPQADAPGIAAAIVDWRDEEQGAPCQGSLVPCHNGLFDSVDELRLVPGMTPELFDRLAPVVTVYGSGLVNLNTAEILVLEAIGCGELADRDRVAEPLTAAVACEGAGTSVASTAFTVPIESSFQSGAGLAAFQAVIDRDGRVLSWSR